MIRERIFIIMFLMIGWPVLLCGQSGIEETRAEARAESMAGVDDGIADAGETEVLLMHSEKVFRINLMDRGSLIADLGLTPVEAGSMLAYRARFGAFIDPMELQAVPGWSLDLVRRILPLVRMDTIVRLAPAIAERISDGGQQIILRLGATVERARGYRSDATGKIPYVGDPLRAMLLYKMSYRQSLDIGIRMEKDAGEAWLSRTGTPDHISGHVAIRDLGVIRELFVGDYEVNLGQGLVQWQGMAFRKGANTMEMMRGGPVFKPHGGAAESRYHRGLAFTIHRKAFSGHFFLGMDRLDAHRNYDSAAGMAYFTSLQTSGLHRTVSEIRDRHALSDLAYGGRVSFASRNVWVGLNLAGHHFGGSFRSSGEPYALFGFTGSGALNVSIDHHLRAGPFHLYGEWAVDKSKHLALTEGLLCSPGPRFDLALQARVFSVGYRSIMESAFAEGSRANNEVGIYIGMEWRPAKPWKLNAYFDRYRFSWLRYGVDGPSYGMDAMVRVGWMPEKALNLYGQFSWENGPLDLPGTDPFMPGPGLSGRFRVRMHLEYVKDRFISLKFRAEYNRYHAFPRLPEQGFLTYFTLSWRGLAQRARVMTRIIFFDTEGYGSRIYAYEGRLPGMFAIPAHFGQGMQWSMQGVYRVLGHLEIGVNMNITVYQGIENQGTGYEALLGRHRTEWNLQIRSSF